jgi:hypothetical protein
VIGLFLAIEVCMTFIAVGAAYVLSGSGEQWLKRIERWLSPLTRRPRLVVVFIGLLALTLRLAILPIFPIPEPTIHDEFSHLLAADTFVHGRLANPTHPMWIHFETFHVNQKPTYASMYYPAQGMLLALGRVVFGHPFFGVSLSVGLMCAAICWMLQGWMPGKWALLGGVLAVMRLGTFSYWANSYHGGALAAMGGALVLGALPRIRRRQHIRDSVIMAAGLAILANTRPFESLFFAIPIAVALALWIRSKNGSAHRLSIRRVILPIALLLSLTIAGMGYYFWRVTGSPFRIPYQLNIETYGLVYFPWQQLRPPPDYHHAVMRDFYSGVYNVGQYHQARTHPFENFIVRISRLWLFFLGPVLTLPFLTWAATRSGRAGRFVSRKTRFLLVLGLVSALGLLLTVYIPQPHYAAPLTGLIYLLLLQSMRHCRLWRWKGKSAGAVIVLGVFVTCLALFVLRFAFLSSGIPDGASVTTTDFIPTWFSSRWINRDRALVLGRLTGDQYKHLVIVRYRPDHKVDKEWVYNEADIDNAKVVWAREMSPIENEALMRYFKDRKFWLIEPDESPPKVSAIH